MGHSEAPSRGQQPRGRPDRSRKQSSEFAATSNVVHREWHRPRRIPGGRNNRASVARVFTDNPAKLLRNEVLRVPELPGAQVRDSAERSMHGGRKSVGSIGSHTTSTRSEGSEWRCKSCSIAEAPRRQVAHVGERRSTRRGPSMDLSKVSWNAEKFATVSVARGSCPGGVEESIRRYTAKKQSDRSNANSEEFLLHFAAAER